MHLTSAPLPTASPLQAPFTSSRRTVLRSALWAAPVVVLAQASPAYATSQEPRIELASGTPTGIEVERCAPLAAGALSFVAGVDDIPAPAGEKVRITLPPGLRFTDDTTVAEVAVTTQGIVPVPALVAHGSAGTYTVSATWRGVTGTQSVTVVPAPGSVYEIRRSTAGGSTTATFASVAVAGVTDAVHGAVLGDQTSASGRSTGANGAVLTSTGTVRYWGANSGATASAPGTLTYNGQRVTGVAFLDTWTSQSGTGHSLANATGGVAATTDPSRVYAWFANGTGTTAPVVSRITGITGTVLAAGAEDGWGYVLTTAGLFRWSTATAGTGSPATLAASAATTAAGTHLSTWGHRTPDSSGTLSSGGAYLAGTSLRVWSNSGSWTTPRTVTLPAAVTSVARLVASDSGIVLLDQDGSLWTYGAGFGTATTWTKRASNVADFSFWGYNSYIGGLWIDAAGRVTQFFGLGGWYTPVAITDTANATLTGITKTFSSDGTYLALRNDGTVHAWGGNLDNAGRGKARVVSDTGAGTTVDLNVWGKHIGSVYSGGGYVIKASADC